MCTVTWLATPGGYELFFNRDELRSRLRARSPARGERGGVAFIAPMDGNSGGTWLLVNAHGLSVGLLNFYEATSRARVDSHGRRWISRGQLVLDLASAVDAEDVSRCLAGLDLSRYRPFTLLAVEAERAAGTVWRFDGATLARPPLELPFLTSSSYDAAAVDEARRPLLARPGVWTVGGLLDFQRSHEPERGPLSPCMHRADARTVSFSRIRVDGGNISFEYGDGPPCRTPLGTPVTLARIGHLARA